MVRCSLPKVLYHDSVSGNHLQNNIKGCWEWLTHCCKAHLISESDASTAILLSDSVFWCASMAALVISSSTVEDAFITSSSKSVDFSFPRSGPARGFSGDAQFGMTRLHKLITPLLVCRCLIVVGYRLSRMVSTLLRRGRMT